MPRIAAAVGVFVLIAGSIAFNIFWHPIVWDSVGPSSHLPQSQQPDPTHDDSLATSDDWSKPSPTNVTPANVTLSMSKGNYSYSSQYNSGNDDSSDSSYSGSYSGKSTSSTSASSYKPSSYGSDSAGGYKHGSSWSKNESTRTNDYKSSKTTEDVDETPDASGYGDTANESTSGRALVRVVRVTGSEERTNQDADVRRLPPVDDDAWATNSYDSFAGSISGPAPTYPTTGID